MSRRIPMKKILRLVEEVQETLTAHPDASVEFLLRGRYGYDGEGDVEVEMDAEAPIPAGGTVVQAGAQVGWSRHWTAIGVGEFILRVSRAGGGLTHENLHDDVGEDAPVRLPGRSPEL